MLIFLVDRAAALLNLLVIVSILLSMIGQATHARWLRHPLVQGVVGAGAAIYAPFRLLMRRLGLPTAPLDFSPMVALFTINVVRDLLIRALWGL